MNRPFAALLLFGILTSSVPTDAQFEGMKYRIPYDANTIVLIDVHKMFGSPVANRDKWMARRKAAYDAGMSALPPDATEVIIAGRSDIEFGESIWELGMVKLRGDRSVTTVAARYGGTIDNIEGRAAARLISDTYVVQLMSNLLAAYSPANRQDVSRWLRSTDVGSGAKLPPYLEQAFAYAKDVGTPIIMGMDLDGVVSEAKVKDKMESFESLKDAGLPVDQFAKLIAGTKGITLGVSLEDDSIGAIRVDFAESPKMLADVGKPLLLEILRRQGAMIDDLEEWQPSLSNNTFLLRGKFSINGMRRIMSVLELPPSLTDAMLEATSAGSDPEGKVKLLASQSYFKSITTLLDDLRGKPKRDHVKTFGQAAIWYDKYARKIDNMSILNVDELLVDYGTAMATSLRQGEMTMKGVGMRSAMRTASNQPVSGGYGGIVSTGYRAGTGYHGSLYGVPATGAYVGPGQATLRLKGQTDAIIRGQERTQGAASVQQLWQYIDEQTAAVRKEMTNKYSADF